MCECDPLVNIVTLAEAARLWKCNRGSIIWAYWHDAVKMRKSNKIWLVDVASMTVHFGNPHEKITLVDSD